VTTSNKSDELIKIDELIEQHHKDIARIRAYMPSDIEGQKQHYEAISALVKMKKEHQ
jgi:hypothetical protein